MKTRLLILALLVLSISFFSCEKDKDDDIVDVIEFTPCESESDGNLLIINNSNERLVLVEGEDILCYLPNSSSDFRIHIPNESGGSRELILYKWTDIKDSLPDLSSVTDYIFKKWKVALSSERNIEKSVTWHVKATAEYKTIATVSFSYFGDTDYNVDIYLNNQEGAKIMTLKPGDQNRKTGLDYGNYTLHYRYWYSDQNTPDSEVEVDWIEKEDINGEDKSIFLVLNEGRNNLIKIIPHYGAMNTENYGRIKVTNNHGPLIMVYVGDQPISQVCYLDGPVTNYESIPFNGSTTFVLPLGYNANNEPLVEETYSFFAKDNNGFTVLQEEFTLSSDSIVNWTVN